ncbi:hypothetical protein [Daejeonella sp.]|uniref:hypothetical protein n=1 Tax=Daejeonella sp. TaxID=2805397 RepID=UPI003983D3C9
MDILIALYDDRMKIKIAKSILFILLTFGTCYHALGQRKNYSVKNAHAHNDYENELPFFTAYKAGFRSIEADVFPVNGKLYVAHDKTSITLEKSLQSLYLEPIFKTLSIDKSRHLILLVDIKENYRISLPILIKELRPLQAIIDSRQLKIVISGNRPAPSEFNTYPDYLYFDDDQSRKSSPEQWGRVGLVSLRFSSLSKWKGIGKMEKDERLKIKFTVDSVHKAGKEIRFWGSPDSPEAWKMLMKLKVDLIGTDKIAQLAAFIERN